MKMGDDKPLIEHIIEDLGLDETPESFERKVREEMPIPDLDDLTLVESHEES